MDEQRSRSTFFNTIWIYGSIFLLLLGMFLRQPALSILALLPLLTAGSSLLWSRYSLDRIRYERRLSNDRVFAGESIELTTSLTNWKWLPLPWLDVEDQVSDRVRVRNQETLHSVRPGTTLLRITTSLRWYERVSWTFQIDCPQRGAFTFGPVALRSGDLFGFFSRREQIDRLDRLIVYPRVLPLEQIGLPPRHPFGEARARQHLITDPSRTVGIREYRPEDSFRFIHWKATAKLQELQVKLFEPTVSVQLGIFLNLDTYERYWEGVDFARAESAIITAASLASYAVEQRFQVGMYANGVLTGSDQTLRIHPGLGPDQLVVILEGLAKLAALSATNFPRLLREQARRFSWGSTIVVVTALMTETLADILAELLDSGHRVVLLRVGEIETPPLPGLVVHSVSDELIGPEVGGRTHYARMIDATEVADAAR